MERRLHRNYTREEEFLEEFDAGSVVSEIVRVIPEWTPKEDANDNTRKQEAYFLSTGQLSQLAFHGAAVYHKDGVFDSIQLSLKSSTREVTVIVTKKGDAVVAEKVRDVTVSKPQ